MAGRLYDIEVWTNGGQYVASVGHPATDRRIMLQRNDIETVNFNVDLDELKRMAAMIGVHPRTLFAPYQANLRIKRDGQYLPFGAQVQDAAPTFSENGRSIEVYATGYLDLLKDRNVTASFTGTEATAIATGIVDAVQAVPGGDMGITVDIDQYETGVLRDRSYVRENAKDKLQRLTNLQNGRFDFQFSADKVFKTYPSLGAIRSDLRFILGKNIRNASVKHILPHNYITGLGSGFGADQLVSVQSDAASIAGYYMRERIRQFNSVINQPVLDENTKAGLDYYKLLRKVPVITITGNELPSTFLSTGDRLFIDLTSDPYTDDIIGWYRLERMEIELDDNDFESAITLYFDNQYVDPESGEDV